MKLSAHLAVRFGLLSLGLCFEKNKEILKLDLLLYCVVTLDRFLYGKYVASMFVRLKQEIQILLRCILLLVT